MTYLLEFTLIGLPSTTNSGGRRHYRLKIKERLLWKQRVGYIVLKQKAIPKEPLKKAKVTLTRYSSRRPDYDGLVSSFKDILDALIAVRVIEDDNMDVIGAPDYRHEKAAQGQGKIRVVVEG